tara:strand:+ start:198 stop:1367 length:1170 start_codon:yes stop_codon:yes gene_type:complete
MLSCVSLSALGEQFASFDGSAEIGEVIPSLGDFDYSVRAEASRVLRRTDAGSVVPALVMAAQSHEDSYVQFRAAVLLAGFGGSAARDFFRTGLDSPNDRVRAAAYDYFEHDTNANLAPKLLTALDSETSEFVRPALVRALAAHDGNASVRDRLLKDMDRGEGYFRGGVIEALGDYRAMYAVDRLIKIASEEGPLRDDALLALGKIGDKRALQVVAAAQVDAAAVDSRNSELLPIVSAAACLLDTDYENQIQYVVEALRYGLTAEGDDRSLLRAASTAAAAVSMAGRKGSTIALHALIDAGVDAADPARAPIALAVGTVALRNPARVFLVLAGRNDLRSSLLLLRDAFDMLDEDMAEERFYVLIRNKFWNEKENPLARSVAEAAMEVLEF